MTVKKPGKIFSTTVLLVFCLFTFRGTILAKRPPNRINLQVKLQAKFRWKKEGDRITPVDLIIKGKSYKFVNQGGKWGIKAPLRELVQNSPECRDAVQLAVGEIVMTRIRDLVGGDKAKAQALVNEYKAMKKNPAVEDPPSVHGPAVEDFDVSNPSGIFGGGDITENAMVGAYNQTLGGEAFFFPIPQPGIGGWDLVSEEDSGGGGEEEDEGGGFFSWLATVICVLVVIFAPIVAAVWLATTAITLLTVTIASLGAIGAVGVAGIVGSTFNAVDDVINGRPLIEIWN